MLVQCGLTQYVIVIAHRDDRIELTVAEVVGEEVTDDQVAFVSPDGVEQLPLLKKTEVARRLVAKLAERLAR